MPHTALQEAQLEEKRSLDALKTFLSHTCEVLGLWKVLSDHQFHTVAQGLAPVSCLVCVVFKIIYQLTDNADL